LIGGETVGKALKGGLPPPVMPSEATTVEIALPLPVANTFTYALGEFDLPALGTRVRVPFGRKERIGWVVGPGRPGEGRRLRKVLAVLDPQGPAVTAEILELCTWIANYYAAPPGLTLRAALPALLTDVSTDRVRIVGRPRDELRPRERALLDAIERRGGAQRVATLRNLLGKGSIWPEVDRLVREGVLVLETEVPKDARPATRRVVRLTVEGLPLGERDTLFSRAPRQRDAFEWIETAGGSAALADLLGEGEFSRSVVSGLEQKGVAVVADEEQFRDPFRSIPVEAGPALVSTPQQAEVIRRLVSALDDPAPRPFLLHGITGSGKTHVYVELLAAVLERGRTGIVLVPEISLTPQTVGRFRARFGDRIAVLHSGLSDGERYDAWRSLRTGERQVAIGARSAVFAPLTDLGVIIVDEEHEGTYKQSEAPRYHARDVAVVRTRAAGAICVLGSATPSLESWSNVAAGKFVKLELTDRVSGGALPPVQVIDLRVPPPGAGRPAPPAARSGRILSPELERAIETRLDRREQTILLLNRRGYSSFVQCGSCGDVAPCPHCSISLTFHRRLKVLLCHHCRHRAPVPDRCVQCGSAELNYRGLGTEQVERVVVERFTDARVARMDVDTTSGRWTHHEILGRVGRGEIDILLGTQMIAKGLDFPNVTLVGVINADVGLHLPDFRASERTFQLLAQVAGRTGRGPKGGEVIVQTAVPTHYAIEMATRHDYPAFAARELAERKEPAYPPHLRLLNVIVSSPDEETAAREAESALRSARSLHGQGIVYLGPAPAPIERLHGRWRWHFLARSRSVSRLGALASFLAFDHRTVGSDVRVVVDRDPVALL